ncbi:MAG: hypothetical protein AAF270_07295 [Pseudomonadota bacterium]
MSRSILILMLTSAAFAVFAWLTVIANPSGDYLLRNVLPGLIAWSVLIYILRRHPADQRWWLGWVGYCVPAIGLSAYLHLSFLLDWGELSTRAVTPALLFRFLPFYVFFAGGIGFSIGWIVGRAMRRQ